MDRIALTERAVSKRITAVQICGDKRPVGSMLEATHALLQEMALRHPGSFDSALRRSFHGDRVGVSNANMRVPRHVGGLFVNLHGSRRRLTKDVRRLLNELGRPESDFVLVEESTRDD